MAFYSMLSRASSSVLPLAIRSSIRRSRVPILQFSTETEATKQSADDNQICVLESKTQCPKGSDDQNLIRVLESKIQCAKVSDENKSVEDMTEKFPFKIGRNPQKKYSLLLTREWQDEIIELKRRSNYDSDYESDEDENNEEEEEKNWMDLEVSVLKKSGLKLEFNVTAAQNTIIIDRLRIKPIEKPDGSEVAYEGPEYGALDSTLKETFRQYLEVRGIKPGILKFFPKCAVKRRSQDQLEWLENVKNLIEN